MNSSTRAAKVTITVPADLFNWEEQERERQGITRSEFISTLLRQRRDEQLLEERRARYEAAYAAQPLTADEQAWVDHASEVTPPLEWEP